MSMNVVTLLYLVASVCFIQALKGLSHPTTSIRGNLFGMIGMGIAAATTAALIGKLAGRYKFRLFKGAPVVFQGQHMLNLVLGLITIGLGIAFTFTESWPAFFAMLALAFVMGVLIIIPIGGADMPVVVSMLNSYS